MVEVLDDRAGNQVVITTVGYGGGGATLIDPSPPLAAALRARIAASPFASHIASVRIERLDVTAKIGFATDNDLSCEVVSIAVSRQRTGEVRVRTVARNSKNFSSRVSSIGEAILPMCLDAHARDIAAKLGADS